MKLKKILLKFFKDDLNLDDLIWMIIFSCAGIVTLLGGNQTGYHWTTRGLTVETNIGLCLVFLLLGIILGVKFFCNLYFWKKSNFFDSNIPKHIFFLIVSWVIYLIVLIINQLKLFDNLFISLCIIFGIIYFIIYFIYVKKQMNIIFKK